MDSTAVFAVLAAAVPLLAMLVLRLSTHDISERHHRYHDTYVIASSLTWTLVLVMIIMGSLCILLGWLCSIGVYTVKNTLIMSFFDAFLVMTFIQWLILRRYKVVTYDDYMTVTPFFGLKATIPYKDISVMKWTPSIIIRNGRNIRVFVGQDQRALLWSGLDLDQILIRINRFDALEDLAALQ